MHLPPPVPIKTYRWEDLRRARIRGGYPWTHLDKPPLDSPAWKDTRYVVTYDPKVLNVESRGGISYE